MPVSNNPSNLAALLLEPSMSMPDLAVTIADRATPTAWTSDGEVHIRRAQLRHNVQGISGNYKRSSLASPFPAAALSNRLDVKSPSISISASQSDTLQSSSSFSSASSGVPGFGYYSGKALKWLGERSLHAVDSVIVLRRTYRHVARLKRWKKQRRTDIAAQQKQKLFNMLEDALEMSKPCYSSLVNKAAAVIARAVDDWILDHFAGENTKETNTWLSQIHVCLSPMRLTRSLVHGARPPDHLIWELLNAVTRVPLPLQDNTEATTTVVRVLARELAESPYGAHHRWLGESLRRIVKQTQETRPLAAEEMIALRSIATRRLERGVVVGTPHCRPGEVVLFAECASQSPWCTEIVRGPVGLHSLVSSLEIALVSSMSTPSSSSAGREWWYIIDDLLASLLSLSRHAWLESSFAATPQFVVVDLLLRVLKQGTHERRYRTCTCVIFTLRNLASRRPAMLHTLEAANALRALAVAPKGRRNSTEEYYRKIACGYARELLPGANEWFSAAPSGYTSENDK